MQRGNFIVLKKNSVTSHPKNFDSAELVLVGKVKLFQHYINAFESFDWSHAFVYIFNSPSVLARVYLPSICK